MALTPPLVAGIVLLTIPPLLVFVAAVGRWVTGWVRLASAFPRERPPPPNAHRVSGQSAGLRGRPPLLLMVTVAADDEALWLTAGGPFAVFYPPIQIPLARVTLRADDTSHGGADLELAVDPPLTLSLGGDGAQVVIARLG
jgi:hypothetical protein